MAIFRLNLIVLVLLIIILIHGVYSFSGFGWVLDGNGWTVISNSVDTKIVYVSNSSGNDSNDGLSESTPVATLSKGYSLLRNGYPDHLLLKRGDTWDINSSNYISWRKKGRSLSEPMVVSYYGSDASDRPIVQGYAIGADHGDDTSNVAFIGINFINSGLRWLGPSSNTLAEDCIFNHSSLLAQGSAGALQNFTLRRSIIINKYANSSAGAKVQGLYVGDDYNNIFIEDNLFYHSGWNENIPDYYPTIYNHNLYLQSSSNKDSIIIVRNNIIADGSSHGIQARSGGSIEDNVFVGNALSILVGGGDIPLAGGVYGNVSGNLVINGKDINRSCGLVRGSGIMMQNLNASRVNYIANNIIAYDKSCQAPNDNIYDSAIAINAGISGEIGVNNLEVSNNIIYNWNVPVMVSATSGKISNIVIKNNTIQMTNWSGPLVVHLNSFDPSIYTYTNNIYYSLFNQNALFKAGSSWMSYALWLTLSGETGSENRLVNFTNSNLSIESYNTYIGGSYDYNSFMNEAMKQSKQNWRSQYTAKNVIVYFRTGFSEAVSAGTNTSSNSTQGTNSSGGTSGGNSGGSGSGGGSGGGGIIESYQDKYNVNYYDVNLSISGVVMKNSNLNEVCSLCNISVDVKGYSANTTTDANGKFVATLNSINISSGITPLTVSVSKDSFSKNYLKEVYII